MTRVRKPRTQIDPRVLCAPLDRPTFPKTLTARCKRFGPQSLESIAVAFGVNLPSNGRTAILERVERQIDILIDQGKLPEVGKAEGWLGEVAYRLKPPEAQQQGPTQRSAVAPCVITHDPRFATWRPDPTVGEEKRAKEAQWDADARIRQAEARRFARSLRSTSGQPR